MRLGLTVSDGVMRIISRPAWFSYRFAFIAIVFSLRALSSTMKNDDGSLSPSLVLQTGHALVVRSMDTSPDGHFAATGSDDHSIRIWDTLTGRELAHLAVSDSVRGLKFSPNSRSVAGLLHQNVLVWNFLDKSEPRTWSYFAANLYFPGGVAFSRDGSSVIVGDFNNLMVWNIGSGKLTHKETFPRTLTAFIRNPMARCWQSARARQSYFGTATHLHDPARSVRSRSRWG